MGTIINWFVGSSKFLDLQVPNYFITLSIFMMAVQGHYALKNSDIKDAKDIVEDDCFKL